MLFKRIATVLVKYFQVIQQFESFHVIGY